MKTVGNALLLRWGCVVLAVIILLAYPARAHAMVKELTFEQLVERADRIVIARVTGMDSHWNDDQTLIVTDVTGEISEVLKGDAAESNLALQIPWAAVYAGL